MKINTLWRGIEYDSLENCQLAIDKNGVEVNSVIIGGTADQIFQVNYTLKINPDWEIFFAEIKLQLAGSTTNFILEKSARKTWLLNGKRENQFDDCIDIDISLTPFTNTLPINRLAIQPGQEGQISVVYFDLLPTEVKPVVQLYTRLSALEYKFENVPNDFEAVLEIDSSGLIKNYPGLFERVSIQ